MTASPWWDAVRKIETMKRDDEMVTVKPMQKSAKTPAESWQKYVDAFVCSVIGHSPPRNRAERRRVDHAWRRRHPEP